MALDRYEERPVVGPLGQYDVSAGQRAQADLFGQVAQVIDKVQDVAFEELANEAAVQGKLAGAKNAVQVDENGKLLPLTTLPDDFTIYGRAYREAALLNYRQAAEADAALRADEIGRQHADDPEGFRQAWNAYTQETAGALHPEVAGELAPYFHRIGAQKFGRLADEKATRERQGALDGFNNAIDSKYRQILHLADAYSLTPNAFAQIESMIQTEIVPLMQRIREINPDFSPAEGEEMLRQYRLGAVKRALMHDAASAALGSKVAIGGVARPNTDVSDRYLNDLVENPPELLAALASPEEIEAMAAEARAWVDLKASETSLQRAQAAESLRLREARTLNAWNEKMDRAAGDPAALARLYLEADATAFSGDPVANEQARGRIKAAIRDSQSRYIVEQAQQQPLYDLLNRSLTTGRPLPNDDTGRKAADLAAKAAAAEQGLAVEQLYDPYTAEGRVATANFVRQFGQMPRTVRDAFSNATALSDPEQIQELAATYADIVAANPQLAASAGIGEKQHQFLTEVAHNARIVGMTANEAANQAMLHVAEAQRFDHVSRQRQSAAEAVRDPAFVATHAQQALRTTIAQNTLWYGVWARLTGEPPNPAIGFIPDAAPEVLMQLDVASEPDFMALFTPMFERRLAETKGEPERAAILALADVQETAGYTQFGPDPGVPTFTRYPIERTTGLSADQIRASLLEDVRELEKLPSVQSVYTKSLSEYVRNGEFFFTPNEDAFARGIQAWDVWVPGEYRPQRITPETNPFQPAAVTEKQRADERAAAETVKDLPRWLRGIAQSAVQSGTAANEAAGQAIDDLARIPGRVGDRVGRAIDYLWHGD
jgi:hypothetical protein